MGWFSWVIFGALAGWIASLVVRDKRGCIMVGSLRRRSDGQAGKP